MEIAFVSEANVTDLYGRIMSPRTWFPEGVTKNRVLCREFFTEDIVVHQHKNGQREKKLTGAVKLL
jgi:hypothetical protein